MNPQDVQYGHNGLPYTGLPLWVLIPLAIALLITGLYMVRLSNDD